MKKFLILTSTGVVLYLLYEACTKPKTITPKTITTPKTQTQTYKYETGGGGGTTEGGGTSQGGVLEIFSFTGENSGKLVLWCSHSLVSRPTNQGENGNPNSFLEYEVKNSNGNTVLYVKNTRSGLHANYANQFNHNTHQQQFEKRLPIGNYTITIKNISVEQVRQRIQFGLVRNNCEDQINEDLTTGQVITRNIQIFQDDSHFKLICDSSQNY